MIDTAADRAGSDGLTVLAGVDVWTGQDGLLPRLLTPPNRGFLMTGAVDQAPAMAERARAVARNGGLAALMRAHVAWQVDLAGAIAAACTEHWSGLETRRDRVRLALHEAVVNALMYGCLRIVSRQRETRVGWMNQTSSIMAALADPARGGLPILVTVEADPDAWRFRVEDPGPGFEVPPPDDRGPCLSPEGLTAAHGRGIGLMRAVCDTVDWTEGGRVVTLRIRRAEGGGGPGASGGP
ncbi:ATP-binding protein [Roseospira marina]|nr:ATP-binding protein [Roseospira marina]MBB4314796.1 anti-sigma regulatory factor (Ser/Thr protein kinase) [Roseospira marina]MBB5087785.1 anti-sigma regulatory factor (Ser/Thr protein kinase) [Roseospira marina]